MRRIIALVATLCLLLTVVSVPAVAETEGTDWSSKEKLTITWTTYYTAPPAEDAVIIKHIEDTFNVDIDMLPIDDANFNEVLNTYIMGNNVPDVIRLKDPGQFVGYVDQGVLGELDMDILRANAPDICAAIDEFQDGVYWTYAAVDGIQYGIPAVASGNVFHLPVVYNGTWLEKLDAEIPTTLEEFHDLMVRFTKEDPDGDGEDNTYGLSSDGLRILFGAYGVNPGACDGRTDHSFFQVLDGELQYAATSNQYKEALKVAHEWYEEGIIDPEFITGENTGGYWAISNSLNDHRIGMTVRGNFYHWVMPGAYQEYNAEGELVDCVAGNSAKEFLAVNPDETLVFGQPVEGPYGAGVKNWNLLAQIYCFSEDATSNPEKWERICAIMEYMDRQYSNDVEKYTAWYEDIYGEEGNYWYWSDPDNHIAALSQDTFYAEYPEFAPVDEYGPTQWGPTLPILKPTPQNRYGESLGYTEMGIDNVIQFSLPMMAEYQTNLTNLKDTWMIDFITGAKDVDADWDAYIAEMNASGLEEMVQEARDWYNANNQGEAAAE